MLAQARIAAVVPVSDIDAAVGFYGDTLGLRLKERRSDLPENRDKGVIALDGRMVERMHADMARRTVAIAEAIAAQGG